MHEVEFDERALDFLSRLPDRLKKRIFDKIIAAKENPFHFFDRLSGREDYKLRVGNYRIIADIDAERIKITLIGHRKNVYKR